ncbi:hypothetical protein [Kitasatospora camelliae]|uniref:Uncharacterized protein n=1 Tax=Kitasatospora camelliae TaxID=3156397 RepID=A0AAU8K595_9ACTN
MRIGDHAGERSLRRARPASGSAGSAAVLVRTGAVRAVLGYARELGVTAVRGNTEHANLPSQRVMPAAGMEFVREDGELKYYRAHLPVA